MIPARGSWVVTYYVHYSHKLREIIMLLLTSSQESEPSWLLSPSIVNVFPVPVCPYLQWTSTKLWVVCFSTHIHLK